MKYYIKTFGCQMNISDSERIAAFLEQKSLSSSPFLKGRGFKFAKKIEEADLVIFNTCGVRQTAENRAYTLIHNLKKKYPNKKIILTGCLADRKDVQKRLKNKVDLFTSIKDLQKNTAKFLKLSPFVKGGQKGDFCENNKAKNPFSALPLKKRGGCDFINLEPKYSNNFQAYIPIMTGCNNFCSYCVVPYARGREISRPATDILKEIQELAKKKYKEITLLGQNVNSYRDKKNNFPKLLNSLAKKFPQINFKFLTSHPKDFSQELILVIARNKNISREIHLPVQAGSSKILQAMNRPYTQKHYLNLIRKAQEMISDVSFTTDIIVGFPGETAKDFQQSVKVFQKVKYNEAYINKYSPRPGTAAYRFGDPISLEEKKRREKVLRKIIKLKTKNS